MLIAGGVYEEICVTPARVSLLGSGGRAALALVGLRDDIELHTFHPLSLERDLLLNFEPMGVTVTVHSALYRHSFEYLHPLARPRIAPLPNPDLTSVAIDASEVLRFGCLEGDFRVTAKRAVYDPQSGARPTSFRDNGSRSEQLALVLNAEEIRRLTAEGDIAAAAAITMRRDHATAIIVKDGPFGAYVFDGKEPPRHVPAYLTHSVYKIGSGDVFSAVFAHAWLSGEMSAADAADLASRRTADYVESPALPLQRVVSHRTAIAVASEPRRVRLTPVGTSTSRAWLQEEISRGLEHLGVTIIRDDCLPREAELRATGADFDLVFVILSDPYTAVDDARAALVWGKPVVAFADNPIILHTIRALGVITEDDLCSALYRTQWIPI